MTKKKLDLWLILLGFFPFLSKIIYMFNAWTISRLDQWDWLFVIFFIILTVLAYKKIPAQKTLNYNYYFLAPMLLGISIYSFGFVKNINSIAILGGIGTAWSMFGLVYGVQVAIFILPSFGILCLSTTSLTYWISYFTSINGLMVKGIVGLILLSLQILLIKSKKRLKLSQLSFWAFVILLLITYLLPSYEKPLSTTFQINFANYKRGYFVGRSDTITPEDNRFFGKSTINRFYFAGDNNHNVSTLMVSDFENIHKIHPASHCFRTSGIKVKSEKKKRIFINANSIDIQEIIAENQGMDTMTWVWYSNNKISTSNFLIFRKLYKKSENWHSYQISTPILSNQESARKVLTQLLIDCQ